MSWLAISRSQAAALNRSGSAVRLAWERDGEVVGIGSGVGGAGTGQEAEDAIGAAAGAAT